MTSLEDQGGRGPLFARPPWGRELRETLNLATPLVIAQLGQVALGFTDTVMVGRLGPEQLAAMAIGGGLYMVCYIFAIGVLHGVTALASQAYGARDLRSVRRFIRQGFWISVAMAVPIILFLSQSEALFLAVGQNPETSHQAAIYVSAVKWAILPGLWFGTMRSFVGAIGRPKPVLVAALIGVSANALLDYALIYGHFGAPAWGAYGAAVATIFVNIFMFLGMLAIISTQAPYRRYGIMVRLWRADWPKFREVLRIGLPSGIAVVLEVAFFIGSVFLMGRFGTIETAAHHMAIQTAAITFMVPLGISHVATIRVGHAYGRGDRAGIARAGWAAFALATVFMSATCLMFLAVPETIASLYVNAANPASRPTLDFAVSFLTVAALFQIFDGAQVVAIGALRGLSDTKVPMLYSGIGYWVVGFGACLLFAFVLDFGPLGIWYGLLSGLGAVAFALTYRFYRRSQSLQAGPG